MDCKEAMPFFSNVEMSLILSLFKNFIEPTNYSALRKITENSCLTEFNCPPMDRPDRYTEPKLNWVAVYFRQHFSSGNLLSVSFTSAANTYPNK